MTIQTTASLRTFLSAFILSAFALFPWSPAEACELSLVGKILTLSGHIMLGDEYKFRDFLQQTGSARIAAIRLDSPGGSIAAAGEIARLVRSQGLTTVVDASRMICASSCTIIFAGGVERVYLHAPHVGGLFRQSALRGLGFHQGSVHDQTFGHTYSSEGTALMEAYYQEFGVPGAAGLVDKAPPEAIYGLSGPMAVSLGIATKTSMP